METAAAPVLFEYLTPHVLGDLQGALAARLEDHTLARSARLSAMDGIVRLHLRNGLRAQRRIVRGGAR